MHGGELAQAAAFQLGCDYSCVPEAFFGNENIVTLASFHEERREITPAPDFFRMATMGNAAVMTCDAKILPFLRELAAKYEGPQLFTGKVMYLINRRLAAENKTAGEINIYYLPRTPYKYVRRGGFKVRVYEQEDIVKVLYRYKNFSNALLYDSSGKRKDMLAVCALNGDEIIGMAGASSDSSRFWQIGIDVLPGYRGMGIASEIVSALAYEVLMHGAVPYYGTWAGNIASQSVAAKCGFVPVWAEMFSSSIENEKYIL